MTDRLGRHGIGVGLVNSGTRQELIFNPGTRDANRRTHPRTAASARPSHPAIRRCPCSAAAAASAPSSHSQGSAHCNAESAAVSRRSGTEPER